MSLTFQVKFETVYYSHICIVDGYGIQSRPRARAQLRGGARGLLADLWNIHYFWRQFVLRIYEILPYSVCYRR